MIGAGPAGSIAAMLLARGGWTVTLIEQHRFPRDKVCGECLSSLGIETLRRARLLAKVQKLQPAVLARVSIHSARHREHTLNLPRPMWGLSRAALDESLLDAARQSGASVYQPARCEAWESNPLRIRVRHIESNRIETFYPDGLLVADGKANFDTSRRRPTHDFGIKAHFENIDGPRDTIDLFGCRGLYGGLAPIEGARWNAAFSVPVSRLREHRGDIQSLFSELTNQNRSLARRLAGARQMSGWHAVPLPRFAVQTDWPADVIPVGNAAAAIEPIGGEGMGLALRSAELAAQCLIQGNDVRRLKREFQRLWNMRRFACRTAALLVGSPLASRLLLPLLDIAPAIADVSLALLGKRYRSPSTSEMV